MKAETLSLFCHASEEHLTEPAANAGAHGDEADVVAGGEGQDLIGRFAPGKMGGRGNPLCGWKP